MGAVGKVPEFHCKDPNFSLGVDVLLYIFFAFSYFVGERVCFGVGALIGKLTRDIFAVTKF